MNAVASLVHRLEKLRGRYPVITDVAHYWQQVEAVNSYADELRLEGEQAIRRRVERLRSRAQHGESLRALLPETFAITREVADRVLGLRPYDVQVFAGVGLFAGHMIEMHTGEGKTLAAVLPAVLAALPGKGVHILTFNDYLARRDAEWMQPVYQFMGLSVGAIQEGMSPAARNRAYQADVTYATAKEAGFDFLRMHLARAPEDFVHRPFNFAIVDEADSILIDEARVPLVIAGARETSDADPYRIAELVGMLRPGEDWETDDNQRNVLLTETGLDKLEAALKCGDLHADENYLLLTEINQALHVRVLMKRDVDYIVRDGRIEVIDEFTGRVVEDRRWPDGLQAALEDLEIQSGGHILGSVALQNFLRQYPRIAGMTATATSAAEELQEFYGVKVLAVPRYRPSIRKDLPACIFSHAEAKYAALTAFIQTLYAQKRPVLVGTSSVQESEMLASRLGDASIPCRVLNAKNDAAEAAIISQAGRPGAVTISTNMAGRGTDIKLGGPDEAERDIVVAAGGLFVIGTNLHESRRIDDQLRGRAGRQGDPGTSQFFVSLEDRLMTTFGIEELIPGVIRPAPQPAQLDHPVIKKEVARVQRIVEGQNYEIRKTLWRYSQIVEKQRARLMEWRREVFDGNAELTVFESANPDRYADICRRLGAKVAYCAEQQVTLHFIDTCWATHLSTISGIREGIHLVGIGGMEPLHEFHRQIAQAYMAMLDDIEAKTASMLATVEIADSGIDEQKAGIQGPSSTWTYLINDRALNDLQQMLFGYGSAAIGVGLLITWPLVLAWGIWKRLKSRDA